MARFGVSALQVCLESRRKETSQAQALVMTHHLLCMIRWKCSVLFQSRAD